MVVSRGCAGPGAPAPVASAPGAAAAGAFGVGADEILAVRGGEVEEEIRSHAAAAGARGRRGGPAEGEISVRLRGGPALVPRRSALRPWNRARTLTFPAAPCGPASSLGSFLGVLLPARILASLPRVRRGAGPSVASFASFFSSSRPAAVIRGRLTRGRRRGPELRGVEVQLAHPLVGGGRPIVTSGHPPSRRRPRKCHPKRVVQKDIADATRAQDSSLPVVSPELSKRSSHTDGRCSRRELRVKSTILLGHFKRWCKYIN